jgi:hypothetical protein
MNVNKNYEPGIFILHVALLQNVGALTVKSPIIKAKHQQFCITIDPF